MIDSSASLEQSLRSTFVQSVEYHDELASTNDRALQIAGESLPLPRMILARRQTKGRGRGANVWWATEGSLTFSLLLNPEELGFSAERTSILSLLSAVAVGNSLMSCDPTATVRWKWPNDVYLGKHKVAGILLEAPFARPPRLVIGIGVNLNNRSEEIKGDAGAQAKFDAASLCDYVTSPIDDSFMLRNIVQELEMLCRDVKTGARRLDEVWSRADFLEGRRICIALGTDQHEGVVEGISSDGELLIAQPGGRRAVRSGTVEIVQ